VNLAALSGQGLGSSIVKVKVTSPADSSIPATNAILCTLKSNVCEQFAFDTILSDKLITVLSVEGDQENSVFLSGYYRTNDDMYDDEYDYGKF
jgi:hypothetical protein